MKHFIETILPIESIVTLSIRPMFDSLRNFTTVLAADIRLEVKGEIVSHRSFPICPMVTSCPDHLKTRDDLLIIADHLVDCGVERDHATDVSTLIASRAAGYSVTINVEGATRIS